MSSKCGFYMSISPVGFSRHRSPLVVSVGVGTCISTQRIRSRGYNLLKSPETTSESKKYKINKLVGSNDDLYSQQGAAGSYKVMFAAEFGGNSSSYLSAERMFVEPSERQRSKTEALTLSLMLPSLWLPLGFS